MPKVRAVLWEALPAELPRREDVMVVAGELAANVLDRVKPELARQGHRPTGPHTAYPGGEQYLTLGDGRRVRAWRDHGYWQLYVYTPIGSSGPGVSWLALTSMADPDGRDFPGDPV